MSSDFFAEPATFGPKLHLFGQNWLVRQKLAGSADGSVRLLWFGDFAVQNFGFCRNWKIRFGRTLQCTHSFDIQATQKIVACGLGAFYYK